MFQAYEAPFVTSIKIRACYNLQMLLESMPSHPAKISGDHWGLSMTLNESYVLRCVWHQCYIYQDIKDIWRLEKTKTEQQQKFWPKREEFKWDQRDTRDITLTLQKLKVSLWREVVRHKFHKLGDRIHWERFFQCLGRSLPYDGR